MTAIPPDARKVVLAAVVPCDKCKGTGCDPARLLEFYVPKVSLEEGIDIDLDDDDLGTPEYADDCFDCDGTGTRTVVTDIEVEAREVVVPGGPTETWWRPTP